MNDLDKMNLIAIVQQLPKDDIDFIETYISIMEEKIDRLNNIINETKEFIKEMPNDEYIGYWKKEIFEILDKEGNND